MHACMPLRNSFANAEAECLSHSALTVSCGLCVAGLAKLTECFRERRVLVVLDDVDDLKGQLNMLLPPRRYLHPSSLVVLTSRNGICLASGVMPSAR